MSDEPAGLRPSLGLFQATMAGVGIILGAGIYVLVGEAAGEAGGATWLAFVLAGGAALLTGLSYAELASLFAHDAGEVIYVEHAFGPRSALLVGIVALATQVLTAAVVALGFGAYLARITGAPVVPLALAICAASSLVSFVGVGVAAWLNTAFTIIESAGLLIIIAIGLPSVGGADLLSTPAGAPGLLHGAALVFFAYIGFESVIKLAEETHEPTRTIPRAIVLSIAISTLLYIAVAVAAVSTLGWRELAASSAPLADVAAHALGGGALVLLAVIALFSTANTVLMSLLAASRGLYGLADRAPRLGAFARVHPRTRTPGRAIVAVALLAVPLVLARDLALIAELGNFSIFVMYALVDLAVIRLRLREPARPRGFRVPGSVAGVPVLPILALVALLALLVGLRVEVLLGGSLALALVGGAVALLGRARPGG